jgi:hypothetical protein
LKLETGDGGIYYFDRELCCSHLSLSHSTGTQSAVKKGVAVSGGFGG